MSCDNGCCTKGICPFSMGLAFGLTYGLFLLFFALGSIWFDYGTQIVEQYNVIFIGYGPTYMGALVGALWGVLHGFIFGFILTCIYNLIACCCRGRCCKKVNGSCCDKSDSKH